jgi:hypothetical protein
MKKPKTKKDYIELLKEMKDKTPIIHANPRSKITEPNYYYDALYFAIKTLEGE